MVMTEDDEGEEKSLKIKSKLFCFFFSVSTSRKRRRESGGKGNVNTEHKFILRGIMFGYLHLQGEKMELSRKQKPPQNSGLSLFKTK